MGVTKRFPGVVANDRVTFEANVGEVHALLGENGAGKTTLCNILTGLYRPDEGELRIGGRPSGSAHPGMRSSRRDLHGPPAPAPGREHDGRGERGARLVAGGRHPLLPAPRGTRRGGVGRAVPDRRDPRATDMAAVARASANGSRSSRRSTVVRGSSSSTSRPPSSPRRRPTSCSPASGKWRPAVGRSCSSRTSCLRCSAVSDRVTILRHGRTVATVDGRAPSGADLARLMVGHELVMGNGHHHGPRPWPAPRRSSLPGSAPTATWAPRRSAMSHSSVRSGEILGIAGVAGNGQRELAEVIAGLRPADKGTDHDRRSATAHRRRHGPRSTAASPTSPRTAWEPASRRISPSPRT